MEKKFNDKLQAGQKAWLKHMKDFVGDFGCVQFPLTPMLTERHLENCRVLPQREAILQRMKLGGIAAEVGVQRGLFSRSIIDICQPTELHLIDIDLQDFLIQLLANNPASSFRHIRSSDRTVETSSLTGFDS